MQITSRAYKTEQKQYLRNEQYIFVYLGVISREAQANATANGDFTIFSDPQSIFGTSNFEAYYATAEENMARCDKSQFFMPRDEGAFALNQGLVTQETLGSVIFTFGNFQHLNIKGLTIDFGIITQQDLLYQMVLQAIPMNTLMILRANGLRKTSSLIRHLLR